MKKSLLIILFLLGGFYAKSQSCVGSAGQVKWSYWSGFTSTPDTNALFALEFYPETPDGYQMLPTLATPYNFNEYYDPAIKWQNLAGALACADFSLHEVDICDEEKLRAVVEESKPDVIVHLAARAGVRPSLEDPNLYHRAFRVANHADAAGHNRTDLRVLFQQLFQHAAQAINDAVFNFEAVLRGAQSH